MSIEWRYTHKPRSLLGHGAEEQTATGTGLTINLSVGRTKVHNVMHTYHFTSPKTPLAFTHKQVCKVFKGVMVNKAPTIGLCSSRIAACDYALLHSPVHKERLSLVQASSESCMEMAD